MIRLERLTKIFEGQRTPAVDGLTLEVAAGHTCVVIGPSGCGKTTTLRLINRLIEPTSGSIHVGGEDTRDLDPVQLRRRIGYVIQQIGLFPHMTVAGNVATVPRLLAWPRARVDRRVDDMLALVGLDPSTFRGRYPRELSGGQRQRAGVARALAGDPPVMLMDEPFGAVDPITRTRLQDELLKILRELHKTIVFVTHDVDEALRMGDRIAILRDGRLVQHGTPAEILARPADAFVEAFVGTDRALKRLALLSVRDVMSPDATGRAPVVAGSVTARDALTTLLASPAGALTVVDAAGAAIGSVTLADLQRALAVTDQA